jgi:flagellar biosynthesis/type III secretory pathway M-ring protein FliF/YscJ
MAMATSSIKYIVPLVAVVLLFLFVVKPMMKALTMPTAIPRTQQMQLPQSVAQLERSLESRERSAGKDQVVDWAKKNPKDATNLVKGWLEER